MNTKTELDALRKAKAELEVRMEGVDSTLLNAGEALTQMERKRGHLQRQIWRLEEELAKANTP